MKNNYSQGSDEMYRDYDNLVQKKASKNLRLGIANCRGRKPVIRDINKARKIISNLMIEINPCAGKTALQKCDSILLDIINQND